MIRVLIQTTSPILRAGLESVLRASSNFEISENEPDVILADLENPTDDAIQDLLDQHPLGAAILLTTPTPEALRAGIRGILPRDATPNQIAAAVQAVHNNLTVFPNTELEPLLATPRPQPASELLTPRETEVLTLMSDGQSNKSIAYRMGISEHTVKFHVTSIMTKLNAGSRTEAVTLGLRQGLILL